MEMPKQMRDKLALFQNVQNQLQMLSMQKQQLVLQSAEVDNALEELGKAGKGRVYKAAGSLLIETSRGEADKFLKDTKDTSSARIQILEKQEKKIAEKFSQLKGELEEMLGGQGAQKPPAAG